MTGREESDYAVSLTIGEDEVLIAIARYPQQRQQEEQQEAARQRERERER